MYNLAPAIDHFQKNTMDNLNIHQAQFDNKNNIKQNPL